MANWDTTNPEDNDIVSQYPANERAARAAVVTNFGVDHHETDDADIGKHEVIQVLDNTSDPTIDAGDVGLWNNGGVLKTRSGAGAAAPVDAFPSGTRMVFVQASAPTGWTQDVSLNDRVLRVVDGAGGGTGGSWTISGVTVDDHAITVSEMPSHDHGGTTDNRAPGTSSDGSHNHTGTTQSDGSHTHLISARGNASSDTGDSVAQAATTADTNNAIQSAGSHNHGFTTSTASSHSHTVDSHDHGINGQGGGAGHNHGVTSDASWRPSHVDVIIAEKG